MLDGGCDSVLHLVGKCISLRSTVLPQCIEVSELLRIGRIEPRILRTTCLGDQVVLRRIDRDPVQPGVERAVAAKSRYRTVCLHERILRDVEDIGRILHVARDESGDPMLVLEHQQVECLTFAALYPRDELAV